MVLHYNYGTVGTHGKVLYTTTKNILCAVLVSPSFHSSPLLCSCHCGDHDRAHGAQGKLVCGLSTNAGSGWNKGARACRHRAVGEVDVMIWMIWWRSEERRVG